MASGIKPSNECLSAYNSIKMNHAHPYAIFTINTTKNEIGIYKLADPGSTHEDFLKDMRALESEGCFAVLDYCPPGARSNSLGFISWVNDNLPIAKRMLYASSKNGLKKSLEGIKFCIHASDMEDLSEQSMTQAVAAACRSN
ncbi:hypothetical protein FBUS_08144 [Fasciolopsis buskii]|uniref:ADF-H domain-containing protein n=1 Tax=Fasciolopsis buskii TaxID=27845 RepID=A0A8E0VKH2_9TREM|nr:hypothetical protein FBUS_08144 [Fasciolopsis buski]